MDIINIDGNSSGQSFQIVLATTKLMAGNKKARSVLGWEPKFSDLDTVVKSTWKFYSGKEIG